MVPEEINLAHMAAALETSSDYRVLRRLIPRTEFADSNGQPTRIGIFLDVETTGLDTAKHEVIELGMVKFAYLPDGMITRIISVYESFNEPSTPVPEEITELTGITDAMVAGHRIDADAVISFATDAVIVIAHNAHFDRKFAERYWPIFEQRLGPAPLQRLNGASMDSTDRASDICWPASAFSIRHIGPLTTAGHFSKFSL
jgi:DNA polymerase-3 subunit epsilon